MSSPADRPPSHDLTSVHASGWVRTLDRLTEEALRVEGVWADHVEPGDWVIVHTRNSTYSLAALGDGRFVVGGGWFRAAGMETTAVRVTGCTWGGQAIHTGLVAAPGMCVEFDNGVRTTSIRKVRLIRGEALRTH
jgi:hypothetical protein